MANGKEKRFYVIDHANKAAERMGANPNRGARRELLRRWSEAEGSLLDGEAERADPASCDQVTRRA